MWNHFNVRIIFIWLIRHLERLEFRGIKLNRLSHTATGVSVTEALRTAQLQGVKGERAGPTGKSHSVCRHDMHTYVDMGYVIENAQMLAQQTVKETLKRLH